MGWRVGIVRRTGACAIYAAPFVPGIIVIARQLAPALHPCRQTPTPHCPALPPTPGGLQALLDSATAATGITPRLAVGIKRYVYHVPSLKGKRSGVLGVRTGYGVYCIAGHVHTLWRALLVIPRLLSIHVAT